MAAMEEKLYLALHDGVAEALENGTIARHAYLEGAVSLCAGEESLFCADSSGTIWRFDRDTLMPRALSCGGPGICDMCLSKDEERLYTLVGEADSMLMSEAQSGRPLVLNRCGCSPKSLSCCGSLLICAGGESGRVHLYDACTLAGIREICLPGSVYSAVFFDNFIYALCLTLDMSAMLIAVEGENRCVRRLCGMPGCLFVNSECIYAATHGRLYMFSREGLRLMGKCAAPGRARRILLSEDRMILHDTLSESVYIRRGAGVWERIFSGVQDICRI